ncbi:hypothetical protein B0H16DRAFT_1691619 [Mycena metata]|uniref:Uncharacterized protein n=1 Tax=Mycena metata TaxID=1033252 RepID=A0AAD7ITM1_9AGAR|nr:hypothetical protein B0H16DRAFT_1691619 [Mycena metata]
MVNRRSGSRSISGISKTFELCHPGVAPKVGYAQRFNDIGEKANRFQIHQRKKIARASPAGYYHRLVEDLVNPKSQSTSSKLCFGGAERARFTVIGVHSGLNWFWRLLWAGEPKKHVKTRLAKGLFACHWVTDRVTFKLRTTNSLCLSFCQAYGLVKRRARRDKHRDEEETVPPVPDHLREQERLYGYFITDKLLEAYWAIHPGTRPGKNIANPKTYTVLDVACRFGLEPLIDEERGPVDVIASFAYTHYGVQLQLVGPDLDA